MRVPKMLRELHLHRRECGRGISVCFALFFAGLLAFSAETPPLTITAGDLQKGFENAAWNFSALTGAQIQLSAGNDKSWDLSRYRTVAVSVMRQKSGPAIVRLRWLVRSRLGGLYQAARPTVLSGGTSGVVLGLLEPGEAELIPVDHQRPWDDLAAAEVTALELRAECSIASGLDEQISLSVTGAQLEERAAAQVPPRVLLDLAALPAPEGYNAKTMLTFRIDPEPADPFANSGDGDVRVKLSDDREFLAFFDQEYISTYDGSAVRSVAAGKPFWKVYLPELPRGTTLTISAGAKSWHAAVPELPLRTVVHTADVPAQSAERWNVPLEIPEPEHTPFFKGMTAMWKLSASGEWQPADDSGADAHPATLWRPVVFWNSAWGEFGGSRHPDNILALRMDRMLEQAAASGVARPLVLLDGETFDRHGAFNWESHPLNGTIAGPGEIFRNEKGYAFSQRWMRYCMARWGLSKAVSGLWLTVALSAPGSSEFHVKIASALKDWPNPGHLPVISLHPWANAPQTVASLGSFEREEQLQKNRWQIDQRLGPATGYMLPAGGSDGSGCFEARALDPRHTTLALAAVYDIAEVNYRTVAADDLFSADALAFDVWVPKSAPPDLRVGVHFRDKDGLWFQALLPGMCQAGDWTTYAVDLTGANSQQLEGSGHKKTWNDYSRQRITEVGLHVYSTHPNWTPQAKTNYKRPEVLSARFDNIRAVKVSRKNAAPPTTISVYQPDPPRAAPAALGKGDLWECHFKINKTFENPFDARQCDLTAIVTSPSGKKARAIAFFDQRCERREENPGGPEIVEPVGDEFFTVRYRPMEAGPHTVELELREGGKYDIVKSAWQKDIRFMPDGTGQAAIAQRWGLRKYPQIHDTGRRVVEEINFVPGAMTAALSLPSPAFVVTNDARPGAPPFHGYLHTASDKRHFQYDDGTFFYPMGPCLRSPSDSRIPYPDQKWNLAEIDRIAKRGTYQYDEYFSAFEKAGINWARVWMCPWWGGLEWRRDWPGYQGLGRYNLINAWRIDHVIDDAEKRGIAINLCLTNHGQFSLVVDSEWSDNPFNAHLGGPLHAASEFFTRADAKIDHQNRLRYVVARYAHSPAIMTWALFSELEFTEEYEPSVDLTGRGNPDGPAPNIEHWHAEMASFLKSIDPYHHLVSTHFSHPMRGEGTLAVPEIDIATSNAYSAFDEWGAGRYDTSAALSYFWSGTESGEVKGFHIFNKPAMVEEQGRHWIGVENGRVNNTKEQLDADLHTGLWGSMVQPLGGATGYWWWLHLHFDNRYADYKALSRFMKDEDMRPIGDESMLEPAVRTIHSAGDPLIGRALKSDRRLYAWIYHPSFPRGEQAPIVTGGQLKVGGLRAGKYKVEFWNTYTGEVIESRDAEVKLEGAKPMSIELPLPAVRNDIAVKVKPAK